MPHVAVQKGDVLLGKYRVEHVLGEGGMGVVVAARHIHLGELFALKLLLPEALARADAIERFLREARAAARLKSEHVARVHDVGCFENGAPYMVMEHLHGHDLKSVLKARGPLSVAEAILYVHQACEAIGEAHSLGIIHRDLKPANLFLIHRTNGAPCVKVLDFGISKELDPQNKVGSDLTKTGMFLGSPHYMSPEQMGNVKLTDARSDIWALGVILFELLSGARPFAAEVMTELVTKVITMAPRSLRELRPDIPPALEAIVLRCLEKSPQHRFQSVGELMVALHPFLATGEVHGRAMTPSQAEGRYSASPETEASKWTTVGARSSGPTSPTATPPEQTGAAWGNTSRKSERSLHKTGPLIAAAVSLPLLLIGGMFLWWKTATKPSAPRDGSAPIAMPSAEQALLAPPEPAPTPMQPSTAPQIDAVAPAANTSAQPPMASSTPNTIPPLKKTQAVQTPTRTAPFAPKPTRKSPDFDE